MLTTGNKSKPYRYTIGGESGWFLSLEKLMVSWILVFEADSKHSVEGRKN